MNGSGAQDQILELYVFNENGEHNRAMYEIVFPIQGLHLNRFYLLGECDVQSESESESE